MSSNNRKPKKEKNQPIETKGGDGRGNTFDAYSDSEANYGSFRGRPVPQYYQMASSLPDYKGGHMYSAVDGNYTDDDNETGESYHEFTDNQNYGNRVVRTGRQRKKLAARSKGGEFQTKRKKRRVYFCCISSEIDVTKMLDYLNGADDLLYDWKFDLYSDVLHLYKPGSEEPSQPISIHTKEEETATDSMELAITPVIHSNVRNPLAIPTDKNDLQQFLKEKVLNNANHADNLQPLDSVDLTVRNGLDGKANRLVGMGTKEVFIFDFGAAVFWGFSRGEEAGLLKTIRKFVTKGMVGDAEFVSGEDDMAFVTSAEEKDITIANDVITIPDDTLPKQRMAVSFAIAQSSVLAIFEARIEQKVEEYKYIPETLAANGRVHLSERQLGMMIGEVFVIRHDVNLHTEILGTLYCVVLLTDDVNFLSLFTIKIDTPDFFWKEKIFEPDYKMVR